MIGLDILIFLIASAVLILSAKWTVEALVVIADYLNWKEFVVAFFTISFGAAMPELFIGITSAFRGIPELTFGNIIGQNIILFTLAPAVCAIILKSLVVESKTVRAGTGFAVGAALLPLILVLDGEISRIDGAVLIGLFALYMGWLFSKKERFRKVYDDIDKEPLKSAGRTFRLFLKNAAILIMGVILLGFSAHGIIHSATEFSTHFALSLPLVGLLIVALGTGLPETYLSVVMAQKGKGWLILGGLTGAVAISSTLVIGVTSLIHPITIPSFEPFAAARIFLIAAGLLFLLFVQTEKKITTREASLLFALYFAFVITELLLK